MTWHSNLPWAEIRKWYRKFRKIFFSKPRPRGEYYRIEVEDPVYFVEMKFGRKSFAPNWEFSYNKRGEQINLARVIYQEARKYDVRWWQVHIRGWVVDDGVVELIAHWEPEPTEHPVPHLEGVGYDRQRGAEFIEALLDESNIEYEVVEYRE